MDWSKIPSLSALRAFEATARCQSFSKAARELNVTHAAIAQHVRALEAEFSESLITRQGRGVAVTPTGAVLAEYLNSGFSVIEDGVQALRAQTEDRPLNIAVTPSFAGNWLMPRIGEFWASHPDISLNLNPGTKLVDLKKDGFDLAIRYGKGDWPGTNAALLTPGSFWVVAHPDLIKGRQVSCVADVADLPWLVDRQFSEPQALVEREGLDFGSLKLVQLNTTSLVQSAARSGLGVTVLSSTVVEHDVATGSLVKLCKLHHDQLGYYLVTVTQNPPNRLRLFMGWLRAKAAEHSEEVS